jgi:hypothetical protein
MRQVFVLILFLLGQEIKAQNFLHIGFVNGEPIFKEVETKKIVAADKSNSIIDARIKQDGYIPKLLNDCASILSRSNLKNEFLFKGLNSSTKNYIAKSNIGSISLSQDCKYLAYDSEENIFLYRNGELIGKIKGAYPQIIGEYIYYNSYENKVDAFVDLYRCKINSFKKRELVLANISEQGILVFDSGNYVACEMSIKGIPTKVVYSYALRKSKVVEDSTIPQNANNPIFFTRTKVLKYFAAKNLIFSKEIDYK